VAPKHACDSSGESFAFEQGLVFLGEIVHASTREFISAKLGPTKSLADRLFVVGIIIIITIIIITIITIITIELVATSVKCCEFDEVYSSKWHTAYPRAHFIAMVRCVYFILPGSRGYVRSSPGTLLPPPAYTAPSIIFIMVLRVATTTFDCFDDISCPLCDQRLTASPANSSLRLGVESWLQH